MNDEYNGYYLNYKDHSKEQEVHFHHPNQFLYVFDDYKHVLQKKSNYMIYPLNHQEIIDFISDLEKVIIIEELEPYLEVKIAEIAHEHKNNVEIIGENYFPNMVNFLLVWLLSAWLRFLTKNLVKQY